MHVTSHLVQREWELPGNLEGKFDYFFLGNVLITRFEFRDNVWSLLTGQPTQATPSIVKHDVKEIETWILRLLSAPVPVPGSTRVEVTRFEVIFEKLNSI